MPAQEPRKNHADDNERVRVLISPASLMGSHVQNPFLLRHEVEQLYARMFPGDGESGESGEESGVAVGQATSQDVFRTFMILAIATVVPYRLGEHPHHPLGYYLAAMPHFGSDFLATRLESVQDLLLICRFGIFYHIGGSDSNVCMASAFD